MLLKNVFVLVHGIDMKSIKRLRWGLLAICMCFCSCKFAFFESKEHVVPSNEEAQNSALEAKSKKLVSRGALAEPANVDWPRLVVLDPGHGGRSDPGAVSDDNKVREADIALDIAKRTSRWLRDKLVHTQVVLTRTEDVAVSLAQRASMANSLEADVFVSIHVNDAAGEVKRGGLGTFILDSSQDRHLLRVAARENGSNVARLSDVQRILGTVERQKILKQSLSLASWIQNAALAEGRALIPRLYDRDIKRAPFFVLSAAHMPSVLLEVGFIKGAVESEGLRKAAFREQLARGIARGIMHWAGYPR